MIDEAISRHRLPESVIAGTETNHLTRRFNVQSQ